MDHSRLTPGAERILARAKDMARQDASDVTPGHLLQAISREESRGSELLHEHGLTQDVICQAVSAESVSDNQPPADPQAEMAYDRLMLEVLSKAEFQSARQGRYAEVGSEHLLWGLTAVESFASRMLIAHGLSSESLKALIDETGGHSDAPLAVDFRITETVKPASDETDLYRILDAAANRVREGVRVLEDVLRFGRDHGHLTSLLKTWRHDLRAVLSKLGDRRLLNARDTSGDVGTGLSTIAEHHRQSIADVVRANCKRVQEGLRSLEEFGKILSPNLGNEISQLRYRFYTIEKLFAVETYGQARLSGRVLYLLVTEASCRYGVETTIRVALHAGVDVVQLREKTLSDRELLQLGKKVREWTREAGALFIMNDRPDLALLLDADGVHVGQTELTVREARRIVGPDRLIGVSTHTIEEARTAVEDGADYLGVGSVFPSETKSFDDLAGLDFVRQVAAEISLPWFAIGGINLENVQQVQSAGATRIAVSHAVCGSPEPGETVGEFKKSLGS